MPVHQWGRWCGWGEWGLEEEEEERERVGGRESHRKCALVLGQFEGLEVAATPAAGRAGPPGVRGLLA